MFQRLATIANGVRDVAQEFVRDNGMLGSVVAFALVFGAVMAALLVILFVAVLL